MPCVKFLEKIGVLVLVRCSKLYRGNGEAFVKLNENDYHFYNL